MIARIKGLKISQASERTAVTGQEMIPFQDGERNGKIRMIKFKDMTMYIFDPTIIDGKVSQEDYDALKQAIEEGKLIYTINSNRNGLDLATEVAIVGGTIYIESPDFIKEEGTDNISQVVFDTITVDGSLNYSKEQYTTTVIKTTGDGTKVLTDNGQYVYIGNLALTNIKFKDGTNTSTYDLVTNGITFRQNSTPCVSWNTIKSGNNIYMDIRIANATASMDGLMSKEDYVELNTTIPGQIEDLKEADSNINNRIDDLDDKIDKEIADREAEIDRIENKFDGVTDKLEDALQKEIEDRKAGDTKLQTNINNLQSTMNTELAKKVGKVTVAGSGNAVTTASISGDTLTLTKGATYNNYVHPAGSAPSKASGFYKFSTDSTSHVASVTAVAKSDITALGIPGQDTTYGNATQSTSGLMSAADKTKLDGISTGANKYVHPTGEAANKTLGLYKVATDATSHVKQVAAVTKKDITDLGIADTGSTLRLIRIGSKEDYEHVVILLWKDDRGTNRIDGLFYTDMYGASRRQIAEAHLWFSKWATGSDYKFILNTNQQGSGFSLVTCTYNGAKWWGLRHINDQAVDFYFDGSMSSQINPTIVKYYNKNTSTVLNAEINSSVTNEASKLGRFDVNGDPYALLSEVNTKVSKAGDTMTGSLRLDGNTGIDTTITTDGNHNVKIGSSITGGWSRGYNFNNNSGETIGAFGCYGAGQTLNYAYIGSTYNNTWQRWNSSGSVITVPLTTTSITASSNIKTSSYMTARYISFNNIDGNNAGYMGSGSPADNDLYFISQRDNGIHISANNNATVGGINLTANTNMVSIGNVTATEKLHVVGNIKATDKVYAANGFFKESDARLKSDIKPLDYTLDQICSIPTVSFIMNDQKQIGTVAQNLEELGFEDIVTESDTLKSEVNNPEQFESFTKDGEEYIKVKKVEYEMLGVLAIEGVKMLKDEIEKLKAEIETLKNKQHE